jgi:hydroxymethylpyrimidine pyrophosphatase-like HAD family hydrolase
MYLKEKYNYKNVIGFGDNLNDISLFEACNRCYAVANAQDELKKVANGVIMSNVEDGVVHWIEENLKY